VEAWEGKLLIEFRLQRRRRGTPAYLSGTKFDQLEVMVSHYVA